MKTKHIKPPLQLGAVPRLLTLHYYDVYGYRHVSCHFQTKPSVTISFSLKDWRGLIRNLQKQKRLQRTDHRVFSGLGVKFFRTIPKPTDNKQAQHPFYRASGLSPWTRSPIARKVILVFHHTTLSLTRDQYLRLRDCFLRASRKLENILDA